MNSELENKFLWVYSPNFAFREFVGDALRASTTISLNFCTIWRVNSCIYLLPIYIFKYTFQQTLYHFSIPFKYYFFILSLIFIYSLCIPNYYIFLIPNNYIFKSLNGNILKLFNHHTLQYFHNKLYVVSYY